MHFVLCGKILILSLSLFGVLIMQQEQAYAARIVHGHKSSWSTSTTSTSQFTPTKPGKNTTLTLYFQRAEKQAIKDGSISVRDAGSACANLNGTQLQQCVFLYNKVFDETCPKSPEKCKE
jgi:hypothetical protein